MDYETRKFSGFSALAHLHPIKMDDFTEHDHRPTKKQLERFTIISDYLADNGGCDTVQNISKALQIKHEVVIYLLAKMPNIAIIGRNYFEESYFNVYGLLDIPANEPTIRERMKVKRVYSEEYKEAEKARARAEYHKRKNDPAYREAIRLRHKKRMANPENREKARLQSAERKRKLRDDPQYKAKVKEKNKRAWDLLKVENGKVTP